MLTNGMCSLLRAKVLPFAGMGSLRTASSTTRWHYTSQALSSLRLEKDPLKSTVQCGLLDRAARRCACEATSKDWMAGDGCVGALKTKY
eukprot:scaffold3304_cov162-Pinguiococcus_pyrenoidosus.AAC.2